MAFRNIFSATLFTAFALARTDLSGCTSTDVSSPAGASLAWYVPGTGELCDFLDCGGGRAPPKTDVPGCPQYSGTSTYSPSYLPGYGSMTASMASETGATSSSADWASSSSADWSSLESAAGTGASSWDLYTTSATGGQESGFASATSSWSAATATPATTGGPLICAIASSGCRPASSSWSTSYQNTTSTIAANGTTTTGAAGGASNGTSSSGGNATASASSTVSGSGAGATAQAWVGAGLMLGLGAVVAAL